ncbi:uncharacterized protein [Leptinotarsa decemlineata]|uniref:uncharacterized protein n=1 Tax=Leptinotarsa decemlineata TaxID=7539 RepID=UPI003D305FA4
MSVILSDEQNKLINAIALRNGFTGDFKVETSAGSAKGDNFLGVITRITIKNDQRKLELILKTASTNAALRKTVSIHGLFCREINIYEIFREFEKFQDEYNITNRFTGHAKLYWSSKDEGNECLVMENIVENGFRLWDKKIPMTPEHIAAVFVEYAKFHAVSMAMRFKKPSFFEDLTKDIVKDVFESGSNDPTGIQPFIDVFMENGSKALESDTELQKVLKKMVKLLSEQFLEKVDSSEWNLVVNHGDCWCNNLMFKYETPENTSKISRVCILDWQLSKIGSPAADLTYFFFAHGPKEVLYDYQKYLKLYHDTVCQILREFSCDPEDIFPYSLLEKHWKHAIVFGVYMSTTVMKIMCCDSDEAPDFAVESEAGNNIISAFSFESRNPDGYNERFTTLMRFLVDTGLLS